MTEIIYRVLFNFLRQHYNVLPSKFFITQLVNIHLAILRHSVIFSTTISLPM